MTGVALRMPRVHLNHIVILEVLRGFGLSVVGILTIKSPKAMRYDDREDLVSVKLLSVALRVISKHCRSKMLIVR